MVSSGEPARIYQDEMVQLQLLSLHLCPKGARRCQMVLTCELASLLEVTEMRAPVIEPASLPEVAKMRALIIEPASLPGVVKMRAPIIETASLPDVSKMAPNCELKMAKDGSGIYKYK